MKKIICAAISVILTLSVLMFAGCGGSDDSDSEAAGKANSASEFNSDSDNPTATIEVEDYGTITVELYYDKAPNTVKNFISLADSGYYDGLIFHRVIEGFMIQGGDPDGVGTGGPGYSIKGEFQNNGFDNDLKHTRGVISMARGTNPDSAGSQFFICQETSSHLDGDYAAFGMVTDGMDVVDKIAAVKTDSNDKPLKDVVIKSVKVDTHGIEYDEPETLK